MTGCTILHNMKQIAIIGSTGSIGTSTLQVVRHLGPEKISVKALAAYSNIDLLEQQAKEFHVDVVAVYDKSKAQELAQRLPGIKVLAGLEGIEEVASWHNVNFVVSAFTGTLGLRPTLAAINSGKNVGLANKESLVSAGALVMRKVAENKVNLIPIDSEHSALFQCLKGENPREVSRMILTASGGPFREWSMDKLSSITVEEALNHPTWKMGPKITIDCSTLMNKGLEVIEAHWLYDMPYDKIEVVVHPQSIIHSMVEFVDGSMLSQMSQPTMLVPIQYALTYPDRNSGIIPPYDFKKFHTLQFFEPDFQKFRGLALAFEAIRRGGSLPCFMNGANEILVERFLNKEISWVDIGRKLEALFERHKVTQANTLEEILAVDTEARHLAHRS